MTIDKAIKVLTRKRGSEPGGNLGEDWDALQLGSEALKRIKELRHYSNHNPKWLLPGETKE